MKLPCVACAMVSAVLALLAGGTGQTLAADFYVGVESKFVAISRRFSEFVDLETVRL